MPLSDGLLWRFPAHAWLPLAGFVLTSSLGILVWSRRWGSRIHQVFALLNLAAALWNLDVLILFTLQDKELAGSLDRLFQIPIVSMPFLALWFIFVYLGKRPFHPLLSLFGVWTVLLWAVSDRNDFITGWQDFWFGYYGRAGALYPLFILTLLFYLVFSYYFLWKEFKATRDHLRRSQTFLLMAANFFMGFFSFDNFGPLYGYSSMPLGNVASLPYVVVMAVTIVRFRLLDVRGIFRYGLIYSSLTFSLTMLYLSLVLWLQGWFRLEIFPGGLIPAMLPALAVALAVGPLKKSLQGRLDRHFFPGRKLLRTCLAEFTTTLGQLECEEEIWETAWKEGWHLVGPSRALVVVGRGGDLEPFLCCGDPVPPSELTPEYLRTALSEQGLVKPPAGADGFSSSSGAFELSIPLYGMQGLLGGCLLGRKSSGGIYCSEEIRFLTSIAGQSRLAIERVRLQERRRSNERLAALGRASAIVSHELRNPLNTIRGAAGLLRNRAEGEEELALIAMIDEEIRRGDLFIENILAACREPGLNCRAMDLDLCIRDFISRRTLEAPADISIDFEAPAEEMVITGDGFHLNRVFDNLLRNAVEASAGKTEVLVRTERSGEAVEVTFRDWGSGIAVSEMPRLFEPFYTTKRAGTGLGLAIARAVMEAHGGEIEVSNPPGGGARVLLRFPSCRGSGGSPRGRNGSVGSMVNKNREKEGSDGESRYQRHMESASR